MTPTDDRIERQSLEIGKWGNLLMAVAGVVAAFLSRSDALLVDGLYSGVNFVSAIVAARISVSVARPADRRYPFGYDAHEALYVTFRSLVLLGIMAFAVSGAVGKIFVYATRAVVPECPTWLDAPLPQGGAKPHSGALPYPAHPAIRN